LKLNGLPRLTDRNCRPPSFFVKKPADTAFFQ
jgi:hypothetical protein